MDIIWSTQGQQKPPPGKQRHLRSICHILFHMQIHACVNVLVMSEKYFDFSREPSHGMAP